MLKMRILKSKSILSIFNNYLYDGLLANNISYLYNMGSLLGMILVMQIITGIFLAMYYVANINMAFNSIEYIMREVPYGWLIRYLHANGAAFFFLAVYIHIVRGLLYGSFNKKLTWLIGVILFLLMIITAFIGYSLVWGQMSYWAKLLYIITIILSIEIDYIINLINLWKYSKLLWLTWLIINRLISYYNLHFINKKDTDIKTLKSFERIGPHDRDVLSVIIGSLLGDSNAEKRSLRGTRIRFSQCSKNVEYLMWFHKFFAIRNYCSSDIPKLTEKIGKKGKIHYYYYINTYTFTSLDFIYDLFYENKIKIVPKNIEEYFTPLALAIWIQDDGAKVSAGLKLCTNSFIKKDVQYLSTIIKNLYNLDNTVQSAGKNNQYIIYFPKRSMKNLSKLVKPFMLPSMYYKLNGY